MTFERLDRVELDIGHQSPIRLMPLTSRNRLGVRLFSLDDALPFLLLEFRLPPHTGLVPCQNSISKAPLPFHDACRGDRQNISQRVDSPRRLCNPPLLLLTA